MFSLGPRGRRPRRLAGRACFPPRRQGPFMVAVSRSRASLGWLGCALAVALVATVSARQGQTTSASGGTPQGAAADPQATFRARIDSVMVDAAVTDKQGNPVTGLTAEDFEIKENNKVQTVETFKYIAIDDTPVDPST